MNRARFHSQTSWSIAYLALKEVAFTFDRPWRHVRLWGGRISLGIIVRPTLKVWIQQQQPDTTILPTFLGLSQNVWTLCRKNLRKPSFSTDFRQCRNSEELADLRCAFWCAVLTQSLRHCAYSSNAHNKPRSRAEHSIHRRHLRHTAKGHNRNTCHRGKADWNRWLSCMHS